MKAIILIQLLFVSLTFSGWCMNLYKFFRCDFEESYKAEIIYAVGIVTPISIVTGWMDFGKQVLDCETEHTFTRSEQRKN